VTTRQSRAERVAAMKETVRQVARRLFAEQGFSATGVRQIAAEAGVDPANVVRYFGSKEGLFLQSIVLPARWGDTLDGPLETLAESYLRLVLTAAPAGEDGAVLAALVRASDRPEVRETLQSFTQELFANRLGARLAGDDRLLRAHLFAAGMTGIQVALWVGEDPVLSGADIDEVIARYAPSLQLLLTPG
jgi:AcrR family transcriptional regulator